MIAVALIVFAVLAVWACVCVVNGSLPPSWLSRRSPPAPERRMAPLWAIA